MKKKKKCNEHGNICSARREDIHAVGSVGRHIYENVHFTHPSRPFLLRAVRFFVFIVFTTFLRLIHRS